MGLTKESQDFLESLRLYLFSSGKKEEEIEDITGELEDHLLEAEKKGKKVDDIIGQTPKEYMKQLAKEMPTDYKGWIKYIPMILLGAFAYSVLGDALGEGIAYTLWEVIGYPVLYFLLTFLTFVLFKYLASHKLSKWKEYTLLYLVGFVPLGLFLLLILAGKNFGTPIIVLTDTGNNIAILLAILTFIALAIWGKTWVWIIIPIILYLPDVLIEQTSLQESSKLLLSGIIVPLAFCLYILIVYKMEKRKQSVS